MHIVILGFGNIGHQVAVLSKAAGHRVSVFCSPRLALQNNSDFYKTIQILDEAESVVHQQQIFFSQNATKLFADADLIFVSRPAFMANSTAKFIQQHLPKNLVKPIKICLIPGNNGAEFAYKNLLQSSNNLVELFALQRVPSVARIIKNFYSVQCRGYRNQLNIANLKTPHNIDFQENYQQNNKVIIENIFQIPTSILPHFLTISLTPSNNILHTARLYNLFKNFASEQFYTKIPLFYEHWDDQSSQILLQLDDELQQIIKNLGLNLSSQIAPLRRHYADLTKDKLIQTPSQLTQKLQSITSLSKLSTPSIKIDENKLIPNFSSRYFCDDFAYGLKFLIEIGRLLNLELAQMNCVFNWYKNLNLKHPEFNFSDYQINTLQDFLNYYE